MRGYFCCLEDGNAIQKQQSSSLRKMMTKIYTANGLLIQMFLSLPFFFFALIATKSLPCGMQSFHFAKNRLLIQFDYLFTQKKKIEENILHHARSLALIFWCVCISRSDYSDSSKILLGFGKRYRECSRSFIATISGIVDSRLRNVRLLISRNFLYRQISSK